jgi:CheY-like chemotaxis protein
VLVDDDALLRTSTTELLEDEGYRVVEAANADEALRVLESRNDVQLLLTDIQMPGQYDGMDLARQVHIRWPRIGLIITSGRLKPEQSAIPDDGRFLIKPYSNDELMRQIIDLISKP